MSGEEIDVYKKTPALDNRPMDLYLYDDREIGFWFIVVPFSGGNWFWFSELGVAIKLYNACVKGAGYADKAINV